MNIIPTNDNLSFSGKYALSNYKACLKGGAIGDALGNPIEFDRISSIKKRFGIEKFMISPVGPTIGAHSGPGTVALFFMGEAR